jgi:hypothetical protein
VEVGQIQVLQLPIIQMVGIGAALLELKVLEAVRDWTYISATAQLLVMLERMVLDYLCGVPN